MDLSQDRLLDIAGDYMEQHNLIGALKMLNKNAQINGNDEESYMMYAEIFDDMTIYDKCVNYWFKYLDYVEDGLADYAEAYEGLAVAFMNMGKEDIAAYYYNKMLMETDADLSDEARQEIVGGFITRDESPLKMVYPPRYADYTEEIDNGLRCMRDSDYKGAIKQFNQVREGNSSYNTARNYVAMCHIICDECDAAEIECLKILKKDSDNVQALTTLAAVKTQQSKADESKAIAERLLKIDTDVTDELYKIATVCCENEMHEKAYELFCKLESQLSFDCSVLFFKAVSAFNCGLGQVAIDTLERLLTIYPNAITARYYLDEIKEKVKRPTQEKLSYFYRFPQEQRQSILQFMAAYGSLSKGKAKMFSNELDLSWCINWCFDEGDPHGVTELQLLGAMCAVKSGEIDIVRDILLNHEIGDSVKIETLEALAERNDGINVGVVICDIFRRVNIPKLEIGRIKKKYFLSAYGALISRFVILDSGNSFLINSSATLLYEALEKQQRLDEAVDVNSLTAAIYYFSGIQQKGLSLKDICRFFNADEANYKKLIKTKL
jgi:tetratricopeptide (TPR) repeat protein